MIKFQNIVRYDNLPFEQYLKLPGYSNSFLKNEINGVAPGVDVTDNMKLGSMVDAILTEPEKVDMSSPFYEPGKSIALEIRKHFGAFIDKFEKQVSYTGEMVCDNFVMKTKGRLDFLIPKIATIDLKVTTAKDLPSLIKFMGYDNQLFNYSGLAGTKKAFLMAYIRSQKITRIVQIPVENPVNYFWQEKIIKFGNPIENL